MKFKRERISSHIQLVKVMLFGLKNAKTTCQKLVAKVFWIKNWSLVGR
jgi:hypothetical protein